MTGVLNNCFVVHQDHQKYKIPYFLLPKLGKRIRVIFLTALLMRLILLGGLRGDLRFDFDLC